LSWRGFLQLCRIEQHYGRMPRKELIARYLPNRSEDDHRSRAMFDVVESSAALF